MDEQILNSVKDTFGNFNQGIQEIIKMVSASPETNSGMWHVATTIYDIILPIGLSLAGLYFIIDFLNKSVMLEYMRWENLVKSLFRLVVAKIILQNAFKLMTLILGVATQIVGNIGTTAPSMANIDYSTLQKTIEGMGMFEKLGYWIQLYPLSFIMMIIKFGISLIVIGRMFEIYIYTALAPIPLAGLTGEGSIATAKNFLRNYAGVCLQGVIIIACCTLYGGLIQDIVIQPGLTGLKDFVMYSLVLLLVLIKSGSWANKLTGGM